jgi:hypothetical protein
LIAGSEEVRASAVGVTCVREGLTMAATVRFADGRVRILRTANEAYALGGLIRIRCDDTELAVYDRTQVVDVTVTDNRGGTRVVTGDALPSDTG